MKNSILLIILVTLVGGCVVRPVAPGDMMELNFALDLAEVDMRHQWEVITPPQLTYVGVDDKESEARGKVLFQKNCVQCHGPTGVGNGPVAEKLNIKPANLQNIEMGTTNTYLVVQINNGKGEMPSWKDYLTKEQMYDLTNYIRTLAQDK